MYASSRPPCTCWFSPCCAFAMRSPLPKVCCLCSLARITRPTQRLNVVDVTSTTLGHWNHVICCEFPTPATVQTTIVVMLTQCGPLSGGEAATCLGLRRAVLLFIPFALF